MRPNMYRSNVNQYTAIHNETGAEEASPHKLIQMLMNGFLMRVNAAKGAIQRQDYQEKSIQISKAVGIIGGLIDGLDMEKGGEIASNLHALYEYINRRLFDASANNDISILDEVHSLMKEVKEGWDAIPEMYRDS